MRCVIAPGCARSVRLRGSTSRIAFICTRQSTRLPGVGTLPPLRPVPEPRVTIGTLRRRRQPHALGDLRGRARKHDRLGPLLQRRGAVEAVGDQVLRLRQHGAGADDRGQRVDGG